MEDFYSHLKQGKTKTNALRQAKLNYLKSHKLMEVSPYYWASFVLIGDGGELSLPQTNWFLVVGVSGLVIILSFLLFKYKRSRL